MIINYLHQLITAELMSKDLSVYAHVLSSHPFSSLSKPSRRQRKAKTEDIQSL